jgi:PBP1b-binding outer membrane lipoprotein LpoB
MRDLFALTRGAIAILNRRTAGLTMIGMGMLALGCASADSGSAVRRINVDERGQVAGLGFESQNLQEVADHMFRSIIRTPAIAGAPEPPTVVLLPFQNETRFPINQQILLQLLKARMNSEAPGKVKFLARNRLSDVLNERQLKREGALTQGTNAASPVPYGATYFLTGNMSGISQAGAQGASDYMLVTYQLIDAETTEELWEDYVQFKKEGRDDVIYR